ncbi:PilW family protein [Xylophilus sp. GW821-FHT01B05]
MTRARNTLGPRTRKSRQRGLTLVELLVAMTLSLLVIMATVGALVVARQGFTSVDAASQLRDNARFASDVIQRIAQQAGYRDVPYAATTRASDFKYAGMATATEPAHVSGFNNALITNPTNGSRSGCSASSGTACANGSDILIVRFQTSAKSDYTPGASDADRSMISCAGTTDDMTALNSADRLVNTFYVAESQGEPALMCDYGAKTAQPLVQGVESFQVLYGVDDVSPNAAAGSKPDTVADRYLRADQMVVASNPEATRANWLRVRSIRIGLVVRGPVGSALERKTMDYYPLGAGLWSTADVGSKFVAPADGRLRQALTFTVYLPNPQEM